MKTDNNYILVGKITKAVGLKGLFKVNSYCQNLDDIFLYDYLLIINGDGYEKITITKKYDKKESGIVVSSNSIENRTDAERYQGKELFIERAQLKELEDGEFYYHDVIGARLVSEDCDKEALIKDVVSYGAGNIFEIVFPPEKKVYLIPYVKENIISMEFDKKIIRAKSIKDYL